MARLEQLQRQEDVLGDEVSAVFDPETSFLMQQFVDQQAALERSPASSGFTVAINKDALETVIIPERDRGLYDRKGSLVEGPEHARLELVGLLERIKTLPETLEFKPGITLIVGENGTGKSTLGKALWIACDYEKAVSRIKNESAKNSPGDFLNAEARAKKRYDVFPGMEIWLKQAGLAFGIAEALDVSLLKGELAFDFYDFTEIFGKSAASGYDAQQRETLYLYKNWDYRSHRQTLDQASNIYSSGLQHRTSVCFFDEPELGLSPKAHLSLEQTILEWAYPGSTIIVPTNSIVLYNSGLPRIDLETPERGIFIP